MLTVIVGIIVILLFIWVCNPSSEKLPRPFYIGQTRVAYPFVWRYPNDIRIGVRGPSNIYNNPANVNIYKPYS